MLASAAEITAINRTFLLQVLNGLVDCINHRMGNVPLNNALFFIIGDPLGPSALY